MGRLAGEARLSRAGSTRVDRTSALIRRLQACQNFIKSTFSAKMARNCSDSDKLEQFPGVDEWISTDECKVNVRNWHGRNQAELRLPGRQ